MPKKSWNKKQKYQAYCREQVKKGLMNDHEGNWRLTSQLNQSHRLMFEHCKAGYKL